MNGIFQVICDVTWEMVFLSDSYNSYDGYKSKMNIFYIYFIVPFNTFLLSTENKNKFSMLSSVLFFSYKMVNDIVFPFCNTTSFSAGSSLRDIRCVKNAF